MQQHQQLRLKPATTARWFGPFCYDASNRRVFVPKRLGWGYTYNFARPISYVLFGMPLLITSIATAAALALAYSN